MTLGKLFVCICRGDQEGEFCTNISGVLESKSCDALVSCSRPRDLTIREQQQEIGASLCSTYDMGISNYIIRNLYNTSVRETPQKCHLANSILLSNR